jgi:hypothetical protein
MTSPADITRLARDFLADLDRLQFTGVSQVAELNNLEILIGKYPEQASEILKRQHKHPHPNETYASS